MHNGKRGGVITGRLKIWWPIVFLFVAYLSGFAQPLRILTTKDGLPQSFVSGLVQDDDGFIWIGTRNGIARYDGIKFKLFQHSISDSATIASNLIIWIEKDAGDNLWIEYESGAIDRLNAKTETVEHFSKGYLFGGKSVRFFRRAWTIDQDQAFWSIDEAEELVSVSVKEKQIRRYRHAGNVHATDTLMGLLSDKKNNLWVLTNSGLSRLNKSTRTFTDYFPPVFQRFGNDLRREAVEMHERASGELMWGDQKQLFFFNPASKSFRVVALPHSSPMGVRYIRMGPDQSEYFELDDEVYRYSDKSGFSLVLKRDKGNSLDMRSFLVDRSGMIWIGTNAGGIRQMDLTTPFFQSFPYKAGFVPDLIKEQFGGSIQQLFGWQATDDQFSAAGYRVRSVYDQQKRLWVALKRTVCYYDPRLKSFAKLPEVTVDDRIKTKRIVLNGLTVMPNGQPMVISDSRQLLYYDALIKKWVPFIGDSLIENSFGRSILPLDVVNDGDRIWITTENNGLIYIDVKTKQLHQLSYQNYPGALPTNQLLGLKPDPTRPDLLWIGSYQGLICLNKKTLSCVVFTSANGLPDNTIYAIATDNGKNLWLSTNKGLCRFQPVTHQVRVFQTAYGLPGDEFNRFHQFELPDGRLAFGGTEGWVLFDPLAIKNDTYNPNVAFTNLKINNLPVNPGGHAVLFPLPLNAESKLNLTYEQNTLTLEFAGLQFNQPNELSYRYQLVGYDDGWVLSGHSPVANYTKIPPGDYTFKINASNTAGRWSNYIRTITIVIQSPWWRTWWAFLGYGILAILIVWHYIRYSVHTRLLNHEIRLKENEADQLKKLDEVKTQFFANITHEFRTPLTLILGPAEQLKEKYIKDKQGSYLAETIESNAQHLLHLINQLMDLAKLEANALKIKELSGNPAALIERVVQSFMHEAEMSNISLEFNGNLQAAGYWFTPDLLERIVYNLVANAIKFTNRDGRIGVAVLPWENGINLIVTDTGIGIPADKLPYVFDRFYQAENEKRSMWNDFKNKGTGIGLALVKELVELQGGNINVQSETGIAGGSTFTVFLPYRKEENITVNLVGLTDGLPIADQLPVKENTPEILVVEDNAALAVFIISSLAGNYKVTHAVNGLLGMQMAFQNIPDLIVSDVLMEGMDGFTLCSQLKDDIRTSHIPIILLTAKAGQESMLEGLKHGADDYLTKPFHVPELLVRIKNQLGRQQRLRDHIKQELALSGSITGEQGAAFQNVFISRLYDVIEAHLDDSLFGVDELVNRLGMSRTSLHRKIKTLTGMSTSEFVRNYRLKRAAQFLQQDCNSSDAAYKTGFGSPAYFSKCFREVYGITPGAFTRKA